MDLRSIENVSSIKRIKLIYENQKKLKIYVKNYLKINKWIQSNYKLKKQVYMAHLFVMI